MSLIYRFELNTQGRDFVIGDPHGEYNAILHMMERLNFNTRVDRMFCTGDNVDRGPDSLRVIQLLAEEWYNSVSGNHEMMARGIAVGKHDHDHYIVCGGQWFLDLSPKIQLSIADLFEALPMAMVVETVQGPVGIVHAEPPLDWTLMVDQLSGQLPMSNTRLKQYRECLLWSRDRWDMQDVTPVTGIDLVYVGHTSILPHRE